MMAEHMVIQSSNGGNGAIVEISNDGGSSSSKHDPSDQDERIPRSVAPSKPPIIFLLSLHQANPSTVLITQLRMNIDIRLRIANREDICGKEHLRPRATISGTGVILPHQYLRPFQAKIMSNLSQLKEWISFSHRFRLTGKLAL